MKRTWLHVFWIALAIKVILAAVIPLSNDEAYYWVWSHHLQWSYYDHPAAVAWLFWLGHIFEPLRHIFGGDFNGVVRIPAVAVCHFALVAIKRIIGESISEKQHVQWLCVVLVSPFFGLGSLIVTPDLPLVLTWSFAMLAFKNHLENKSVSSGALLGAALGAGFCAKYHIVLFVPVAVAHVFWKREWRLVQPKIVAAAVFWGLLFSAPVWGWNATHDWISFRFQLNHGLNQEARSFERMFEQFLEYGGAQLALLSPLVLFNVWKFNEPKEISFLRWFGWAPILFFAWTSFRSPVEANWPIAGHMPLLVLASINDSKKWLSRGMIGLWSFASVIVIYQGFHPEQNLFGIPAQNLKTHEFVRFRALEDEAKHDNSLFASSYQMAGALSIAADRTVAKLAGINRMDFFDFNETGHPMGNRFTVAISEEWPWPAWIAERGYAEATRRRVENFTIVTFVRDRVPDLRR